MNKFNLINWIKEKWFAYFDRRESLILLWIVGFGFLLRLLFITETQNTPFVQYLFSDSQIYNNYALNIAQNNDWIGKDAFFMSPIYPYFLAVIYKIFGQSTYLIRLLQVIISTITIFLIYLISKNLFSKKIGYVSAAIAAFYSQLIFYSGLILSETLQVFVSSLLLFFLTKNFDNIYKKWFVSGIWLGLLAIFRANILVFAVLIVVYFIIKIIKQKESQKIYLISFLRFILGMMLIIAPVTIRNYMVSNDFVLITSNGGINFYIGNNEKSLGVFTTPTEFNFASDMSGEKYAEKLSHRDLSASEASSFWYEQAIKFMEDNPLSAIYLMLNKIFLFFLPEENPQSAMMDYNFYKENFSRILQLPLIDFSVLSILFVLGSVMLWKDRRKYLEIYLFAFAYFVSTIIFFVNGRFRLALLPVIIPISAYSIIFIIETFSKSEFSKLKKPVIIVAVLFLIANFGSFKPKFTDYDAYLHLGDIAYKENRLDEAIYNYNLSLIYQDNYMTFVNLGNALAKKKDFKGAEIAYKKAIERNENYELAYFNLAFVYTQLGNFDLAVKNYNKTIELNPNFESAYRNLGIVYYVSERYDLALEFFNEFMRISNDELTKKLVEKDIENIKRILENKK